MEPFRRPTPIPLEHGGLRGMVFSSFPLREVDESDAGRGGVAEESRRSMGLDCALAKKMLVRD